MPYLPIDPKHTGRTYEAIIQVNSQSGKGGVAYVMDTEHGLDLPRRLQIEFSKKVQAVTEASGTVIRPGEMWEVFAETYLPEDAGLRLVGSEVSTGGGHTTVTAQLLVDGQHRTVAGEGNGPIDALVSALRAELGIVLEVKDYSEHALTEGSGASAVAYVEVRRPRRVDLVGRRDGLLHPRRLAQPRWSPRPTGPAPGDPPGDRGRTSPSSLAMIRELAEFESLSDQCVCTEEDLAPRPVRTRARSSTTGRGRRRRRRLAGHALWFRTFSTFLGRSGIWLEDLYVRPAHRRQGPRRALLMAHLRARTEGRVEWEVLEWNEPAIDFYQRLGARPMAGWTSYRWYDG